MTAGEAPDHIVAQPLRSYRGWKLVITCQHCGTYREIEISELHDRYGERSIRDIVERLTCRDCRGLPSSIELRHKSEIKWIVRPR